MTRSAWLLVPLALTALVVVATAEQTVLLDTEKIYLFAEYSSAAYCNSRQLALWGQCRADSDCRLGRTAGFTLTKVFETTKTGVFVYIGFHKDQQVIVASFRGLDSPMSWIETMRFRKMGYEGFNAPPGVKVHSGFYKSYLDCHDDVIAEIVKLHRRLPSYGIYITGHSIGGAIGNHAVIELAQLGINSTSYTYGQPRAGNDDFAKWFRTFNTNSLRITQYGDPVVQFPPQPLSYHHLPQEIWIQQDGATMVVCDDYGEDPDCSNSLIRRDLRPDSHKDYLGLIMGPCYLK